MSVFLGIGMGPIQTGIFIAGADKGKFERIVIAEVDDKLKDAINSNGGKLTVNIADDNSIYQETYHNIEVYNPLKAEELEKLIAAAAEATELATALPSVKFFASSADWLRKGFARKPQLRRFIYTAENDNHAAEKLAEVIGEKFPETYYLNTVVGKMSGVVTSHECEERALAKLAPDADRGHLVEKFNCIYISSCPGIEERKVRDLYVKKDLYPFEEAKLYGHNAIHFLLGTLGKTEGLSYMSELRSCPELIALARKAFIDECGAALCKKYAGVDELFTPICFKAYAEDLLVRMTNKYLQDAIERITRDIPRKMSWDDRVIGTIRLVLSQGVQPDVLCYGAHLAASEAFGDDTEAIKEEFSKLWPSPWNADEEKIFNLIITAKR